MAEAEENSNSSLLVEDVVERMNLQRRSLSTERRQSNDEELLTAA